MKTDVLSRTYDAYYYAHDCGRPYQRDEVWLQFFGRIADRVLSDIQPRTVLDAGCGMGFLVETLRDRAIEAYGLDISTYAIDKVYDPIKPYCRVGSVTEPFSQRYDLIVCIEVLEHLSPHEAEQAIANFCTYTDDILFSSTPLDFKEATHVNVQLPSYWAELFARHGFFHDVDYDASYLTPWAMRFRRTREPIARLIAAYERKLWHLTQENEASRELHVEQRDTLAEQEQSIQVLNQRVAESDAVLHEAQAQAQAHIEKLQAYIEKLNDHIRELDAHARAQDERLSAQDQQWMQLQNSLGGKILHGLQKFRAFIAPPRSLRDQILDNFLRRFVVRK